MRCASRSLRACGGNGLGVGLGVGGRSRSRAGASAAIPVSLAVAPLRASVLASPIATLRPTPISTARSFFTSSSSSRRFSSIPAPVPVRPSTSTPARGFASGAKGDEEDGPLTETVRHFLAPADFYSMLAEKKMDFFTGVPDSLLKDFCSYVSDTAPKAQHVITANEGASIALATGYHLGTRKFPVVYMQNSGFGNTVNPLLSLTDPKVYSIPMLLLIGWRGEPGKKDEPQHIVQGKVMSSLLTDMNIQYEVLPDYQDGAREALASAYHYMETRKGPYAFLVKRQTFTPYKMKSVEPNTLDINREAALKLIVENTHDWDILVATTGFTSRELYEIREERKQDHSREFLTVGSMGHASAIALGVAMSKPSRQVFCVDGDGALLMHMGTLATAGNSGCKNFKHILINNGAHDSVGGQPTAGFKVNFPSIAKASGYAHVATATTPEEIAKQIKHLRNIEGPAFLEIRVNKGARKNLGRPKSTPIKNKDDFMKFLEG